MSILTIIVYTIIVIIIAYHLGYSSGFCRGVNVAQKAFQEELDKRVRSGDSR